MCDESPKDVAHEEQHRVPQLLLVCVVDVLLDTRHDQRKDLQLSRYTYLQVASRIVHSDEEFDVLDRQLAHAELDEVGATCRRGQKEVQLVYNNVSHALGLGGSTPRRR
jgi:hypothetical protein